MNLEALWKDVMNGYKLTRSLTFIGPICRNLDELTNETINHFDKIPINEYILRKRAALAVFIEKFHKESGLLNEDVIETMRVMSNEPCILLMSAHQPNFFAYSGIFQKVVLIDALADEIAKRIDVSVIKFFGFGDQDLSNDRWWKVSELPRSPRHGGNLTLNEYIPSELDNKLMCSVPKISEDALNLLKYDIKNWIKETTKSTTNLCKALNLPPPNFDDISGRFSQLWDIVDDSYRKSENLADFNSFFFAKVINDQFRSNTLFARLSECEQVFTDEFNFLLKNSEDYYKYVNDARGYFAKNEISVSDKYEKECAPFWYHCKCNGKVRINIVKEKNKILGEGKCLSCGKKYDFDFSLGVEKIAPKISARAIQMPLIFFQGLNVSCYVGGMAGIEYLMIAKYIAKQFDIKFPIVAIWRPFNRYAGIGQLETLLEVKRIRKEYALSEDKGIEELEHILDNIKSAVHALNGVKDDMIECMKRSNALDKEGYKKKIEHFVELKRGMEDRLGWNLTSKDLKTLKGAQTTIDLMPSIVDYAINIGFESTYKQWLEHLHSGNQFVDEVRLNVGDIQDKLYEDLYNKLYVDRKDKE